MLVAQSYPILCHSIDWSLPNSSFHGILQAEILEWVALSFSRGSDQPRDQSWVSRIAADSLPSEPPGKLTNRILCNCKKEWGNNSFEKCILQDIFSGEKNVRYLLCKKENKNQNNKVKQYAYMFIFAYISKNKQKPKKLGNTELSATPLNTTLISLILSPSICLGKSQIWSHPTNHWLFFFSFFFF